MKKRLIQIDMDDTTFDFGDYFGPNPVDDSKMFNRGFFRNLKPVSGALWAVRKLIRMGYDVQILTQPVAESARCYAEKVQWIGMWFPELLFKINMVQDKGLARGNYLVDDNADKWQAKFEANGNGKFVHYKYQKNNNKWNKASWQAVVLFFEAEKRNER